jgi:uncharacterized membrane protein YgdD (TMEM256/DUF423 family)
VGFAVVGAVFGFLSVAFGAFGAHVLTGHLSSQMVGVFDIGAQYQMYHALALLAVGILIQRKLGGRLVVVAGWLFTIGIVLFSGSLYVLSMTDAKALGVLTPVGGLCLLAGWVFLAIGLWRGLRSERI